MLCHNKQHYNPSDQIPEYISIRIYRSTLHFLLLTTCYQLNVDVNQV